MTAGSRTSVLLCVALLSAAGVATGCSGDDTSRFEHTTVKTHAVAEPVRAIVVKAQSGDIDLIQTSARSFVRETQHYDAARPTLRVAARAQSGNVAVTVPKGEYTIDASTGSGTLNTDGIARNDRAPQSIDARTTSGNVSLRAG